MRVLVCGGRDFTDWDLLRETLTGLFEYEIDAIIHGGAIGADSLAGEFARAFGIEEVVFKADWKKYGKAAGPIRNAQMPAEGKPDLVVAFPGGNGTSDMVKKAKAHGVTVMEVTSISIE